MDILKVLQGKRTYIVTALAFILGGLHAAGFLSQDWLLKIDLILGPLGLAFLRAGVAADSK